MRGPAQLATYLGRILVVLGFVMILVAWNGAASLDFIQGQFPFLLSGAMPGLALIIVGAGLEYIQSLRTFTARRATQMAELNVAVVHLVKTLREHGGITPAPDTGGAMPLAAGAAGAAGVAAVDAPGAASQHAPGGARSAQATAVATTDDEIVVAGRSSYHRAACHLVAERDDMPRITRLEAQAQSLSPCRVCKP